MSVSENGVDACLPNTVFYALKIVRDFFGELPERVCATLFAAGPLCLRDIRQKTDLTRKQVSNALIVLVQHSYVQALLQEEIVGPRKLLARQVYKADLQRIVQCVRQPRFLMHISDALGDWSERVTQLLVLYGRLPFELIVQRIAAEAGKSEKDVAKKVASTLVQLMRERFVEQVPPCDMPLIHAADPRKAVRKPKATPADETQQLRSAQLLTVAQYEKLRFQLPAVVLKACLDDSDAGLAAPAAGLVADDVVLLRLNFAACAVHFRHAACADLMTARSGIDAGRVVRAMLEIARPQALSDLGREPTDVYMSVEQIRDHMLRMPPQQDAPSEAPPDVIDIMQQLIDSDVSIIEEHPSNGGSYKISVPNIVSMVQFQMVNAYLKQRFGERGLRVWRLLLMEHYLQAEHIEKMAMMNTRDVRTTVYDMFKAGYCSVQEVPKSGEHAPSKTMYAYHVDYHRTLVQLVSDVYKAAGNLTARCAFEMEREKDILELAHRKMRGDSIKMSSQQLQAAARLQQVVRALHLNLLNLDSMLMVYSFGDVSP